MILLQEPPRKTSSRGMSLAVRRREDEPHVQPDEDARIATALRRRLVDVGNAQIRQLGVSVTNGRATLTGRLNRFYLLQLAQSAALQTPGVDELHCDVHIVKSPELDLAEE